ncbi:unnamed protein product [Rhodiola kirilowii]
MNGVSIASSSSIVFPLKSAAKLPKSSFNGVRLRTAVPVSRDGSRGGPGGSQDPS